MRMKLGLQKKIPHKHKRMEDDLIATFVSITGATASDAAQYLEV